MKSKLRHITSAYKAVANIAYKTNEIFPIYPCTPTSEMSSLIEEWSAKSKKNSFETIPLASQMQSEGGVAGAMHGALQVGALASTFTASQGLLLMIPNMYKIAGQLIPNVIHVATRSIATHALSVFGDHSDIMATRQTGYAFLGSASVQEAQDFALIAQVSTLKSRIPFVHFFDGFRTSHEVNIIERLPNRIISQLIDEKYIKAHRKRALNPENPVLKGTTQGADVFFQSREAQNKFYYTCPDIVQEVMNDFYKLTKRKYKLFDYTGHSQAEQIIVSMASSCETIEETVTYLNKLGCKYGLIKVRLFRPFSKKHLIEALPRSVNSIAVLDRTKEPGSSGEPLYLDIVKSLTQAYQDFELKRLPKVIGGRYGLSSKEFTPAMVRAIFENLKTESPKQNFTVGINDDVTGLSLKINQGVHLLNDSFQAIFYGEKTEDSTANFNQILTLLGKQNCIQGYAECDYKKSNSRNVRHLRMSRNPIRAPYLIEQADFVSCENIQFVNNDNAIEKIKTDGKLLVNTSLKPDLFWKQIKSKKQQLIRSKNLQVYIIDMQSVNTPYAKISNFYSCFLYLIGKLSGSEKKKDVESYIIKVNTNLYLPEATLLDTGFSETLLTKILEGKGNEVLVSELPVDGTYPIGTSIYNSETKSNTLPVWNPDSCIQCGVCTIACPQAAIRAKAYENSYVENAPESFKSQPLVINNFDVLSYSLQVNKNQCNSCNNCVDVCPVEGALLIQEDVDRKAAKENWEYFESIPEYSKNSIDKTKVEQIQFLEPLFKYSIGVKGCGEAPYLKLVSQLFGDRMLVANATGASSIFGGALPTTPWSKNKEGKGPAWANSLFEDNAEFGFGYQLAMRQQGNTNNSNWIIGGDGWAYDIGYSGLDHVLASGENVNILVLDNEVYDNTGGQMSKATPLGAQAHFAFNGKQKQKKDLGLIAMQYKDVYVASVAIAADQEQTLKAFNEAESYDGPSLIIAYCHSSSHGIDMKHPSKYHKAAVNSGQWILYRHDPRKSKAFQLDSKKPSIPIKDYLKLENRFSNLFVKENDVAEQQIMHIQDKIDARFNKYKALMEKEIVIQ